MAGIESHTHLETAPSPPNRQVNPPPQDRIEIPRDQYDAAMTLVADALFALDDAGRVLTVFPSTVRQLGFQPEQLIGRDWAEAFLAPPIRTSDREEISSLRVAAIRDGGAVSIHRRFARADGTAFLGEAVFSPLKPGHPPFQICRLRDISHSPNQDGRFVQAVEAAPYPMVVADGDGKIVLSNRKMDSLFGYARNELIGQTVEVFLPESHRSQHIRDREEYARQPELRQMGAGRDLFGKHKDGRLIPVEIGLSPIQDGGELLVLAAVVDITFRKQLERDLVQRANQIAERNEELARKNVELDEFSYIASHDLQEPLRKLMSFGKLLPVDLGENLPPRAAQDLAYIVDAAHRMQRLIQDLLALSRTGRAAMTFVQIELDVCLDLALDQLSGALEERQAVIERDPLPVVIGDPTMLTQVFQNLIGNAVKFTPPERTARIRITAEPTARADIWRIGVQDNAIGIKPEYLDRIFAPFKRLHSRAEVPGNGIGLAICRRAIERHGGAFTVTSTPGEGSHFTFTLKTTQEVPQWNGDTAARP